MLYSFMSMANRFTDNQPTNMNTEKRLRGRPHKREEDKLIGRRISMTQNDWDSIDEYISDKNLTINQFMMDISEVVLLINSGKVAPCESEQ